MEMYEHDSHTRSEGERRGAPAGGGPGGDRRELERGRQTSWARNSVYRMALLG